jgi:hypothetical protein
MVFFQNDMQLVASTWYENSSVECTRSLGGDKIFIWISCLETCLSHHQSRLFCSFENLSHTIFFIGCFICVSTESFLQWRHISSIIIHHHIQGDKIVLSCVCDCVVICVCVCVCVGVGVWVFACIFMRASVWGFVFAVIHACFYLSSS